MDSNIVVRFAPSPTGYLHVGGARTAIYNWLFARGKGGRFLLRIEDTDRKRSSDEMTREILDGLRWLGLDWDEEPMIQSSRMERHTAECLRLHAEGKAYYCYCPPELLDEKRARAEATGGAFVYDRTCLHLTAEQRAENDAKGMAKVLRFLVPEGTTRFYDMVHDAVTVNNGEVDDFIILRSDGTPVYMIAVVIDDHDLGITHVLRGDDHLPNTPKQILLDEALGYLVPMFGHLPMILGGDKKRLSKRHGATSVGEYQQKGYLPEAVFNFLALLGWSPGDDREIMSRDELVSVFDARRILKKSAAFDEQKLLWMNGQHLRLLSNEELLNRLRPYAPEWLKEWNEPYLLEVVALMRERLSLLPEFFEKGAFFFFDPEEYEEKGVQKHWTEEGVGHLASLRALLPDVVFAGDTLDVAVRDFAERRNVGVGKVIHPLRLALTGSTASPGMFETMAVLGKETCLRRIDKALAALLVPAGKESAV